MLSEKKLTLSAKTFVDGVEIASYGASINVSDGEVSFWDRQLDKVACKENRDVVRADRAEFDDFAYMVADWAKEADESNAG